jgi:hypothetical protein
MVARERNEVALFGFLKSFQTPRHEVSVRPATSPLKPKEGLNGPPEANEKRAEWLYKVRLSGYGRHTGFHINFVQP